MNEKKTVATPSPEVIAMQGDWTLAAALLGGTKAMRAEGTKYLPQWPNENGDAYAKRLAVSVLFPAFRRTVETLAAKPFSKPITPSTDMPPELVAFLKNVDREGRNADRFGGDLMEDALGPGMGGILVEYPTLADLVTPRPGGVVTMAEEQAAGVRPYWLHIRPWQLLGWKTQSRGAGKELTQLRLMERVTEPQDEFHDAEFDQVRVLEKTQWRTYRRNLKSEWVKFKSGENTLGEISFIPFYGRRLGFLQAEPPLLDLAYMNVAHWQSASDQQNILHVARVPILVARNMADRFDDAGVKIDWTLTVGAGAAVRIEGPDSSLSYCEHAGSAIGAGSKDLEALEQRMQQAGAELLVIGGGGGQTRIEARAENEVGMCALQRITLAVEDALNLALVYTAKWQKVPKAGTLALFRDFGAASLEEASAALLLASATAGKLSDETLHSEFQRRGMLSADVPWKTEKARLELQGPALGTLVDESGEPVAEPGKPPAKPGE